MIDLRQAGVDDAAELSRIQVDSWQAYESIFSPAYMAQHNTFEPDSSYLKFSRYQLESSALGAALVHIESFIQSL